MKQLVRVIEDYSDKLGDCFSLEELLVLLEELKKKHGAAARPYFGHDYHDNLIFELAFERAETDLEYKARLDFSAYEKEKKQRRAAKKQESLLKKRAKEKEEYIRLKAIYEGKE